MKQVARGGGGLQGTNQARGGGGWLGEEMGFKGRRRVARGRVGGTTALEGPV